MGAFAIWASVGAAAAGCGLVAIQLWAMVVGRLLRLDVGRFRAVGMGALPLRPLVLEYGLRLVLVAGCVPSAIRMESGTGGLFWLGRIGARMGRHRVGRASAV